jgi:hypothetical protein
MRDRQQPYKKHRTVPFRGWLLALLAFLAPAWLLGSCAREFGA